VISPEGLDELERAAALVLCPRFPASEDALQGLDFGAGRPRRTPGGFCVFKVDLPDSLSRVAALRTADGPLPYLCSDLERGAGQQIDGLSRLPPALALGAADDEELARRAGHLTGREAAAAGIAFVFAPVLDVMLEPSNPIVAVRSFGRDPMRVARLSSAWIAGCQAAGVHAVCKHYPGHGATTQDSHIELPVLKRSIHELESVEELPFRRAFESGCAGVMVGHLHVPALDGTHVIPASLSTRAVNERLCGLLGFDGVVFTDALDMGAIAKASGDPAQRPEDDFQQRPEDDPSVRALRAGCDVALVPADPDRSARALVSAVRDGHLAKERLLQAAARVERTVRTARVAATPSLMGGNSELALEIARRSVVALPTAQEFPVLAGQDIGVQVIADADAASSSSTFLSLLSRHGIRASGTAERPDTPLLLCIFSDVRAWKGRVLLDETHSAQVEAILADCEDRGRRVSIVSIGCPQAAMPFAGRAPTLFTFDTDPASLIAAADALGGTLARTGTMCW